MANEVSPEIKKLIQRANELLEMFELDESDEPKTMVSWYGQKEQLQKVNALKRAIKKVNQ